MISQLVTQHDVIDYKRNGKRIDRMEIESITGHTIASIKRRRVRLLHHLKYMLEHPCGHFDIHLVKFITCYELRLGYIPLAAYQQQELTIERSLGGITWPQKQVHNVVAWVCMIVYLRGFRFRSLVNPFFASVDMWQASCAVPWSGIAWLWILPYD